MSSLTAPPAPEFNSALIVDDHPLFCDALSMTLKASIGISEVWTAADLDSAVQIVTQNGTPDVIVLDLNLPDVNGLEGLVRLKNMVKVPVIVVSSMDDDRVISAAIHAGASGFVPKHSQREVFQAAFRVLHDGQRFLPPGHVLLDREEAGPDDAISRLASLTKQQARILQLICEGKLNKQIAYDLSIAETTVKAHVTAIMRKLGVQSRTQAVLIAKSTSFANTLQDSV
ncbi:response regulator transcription factor [Ruegeria sp. 2012CJ41-6]|uniref:Response regulator transcription factor n=1 Tax=Ruegeria spongiae TaxID=2942209 RepID=A0ABT0PYC7_9RHOB|nr:response regulator transcription factor [Ruegeria spongiae]MCL6282573.1 response regulator transcription factor [Ruegeria spongiae]